MSAPRVSVIMPFLNAQAHFAEAIDSVIDQSFTDWELLLIDDGSTDASPAMARDYALRDPRINVLSPDPARRGAAAARNRGIVAARGTYLCFLDADDLYDPAKIAHDVAALDADAQAAWVYGATRWFHDDGSGKVRYERLGVRFDRRYPPPTILNRIMLEERGDVACTCGVMIRQAALDEVGGFEERFALYEDQALWVKLLLHFPVRILSGCNAAYRQHAASTSSTATEQGDYDRSGTHPARDAFLDWVRAYAEQHSAPPSVFRSLARAQAANNGRLWPRLMRTLRVYSRFLY